MRIYYDKTDASMDGLGWNAVDAGGVGGIAGRFATREDAEAWAFAQAYDRMAMQGTFERIPGVAQAAAGTPDEPDYLGETSVCWDDQTSVTDSQGRPVYVDEDGCEHVWDGRRFVEVVATTHHAVVPVGVRFPRIWQAIALLRSLR